jgi:restriction system protein
MLPSGKQRMMDNRVSWAIAYLKKAGLIEKLEEGLYKITSLGKAAFQDAGMNIDIKYLDRYESFKHFHTITPPKTDCPKTKNDEDQVFANDSTPQDAMDAAFQQINNELANDILTAISERSPQFFERLVINLLLKMGYGGAFEDPGIAVGKSGDEGIDGIIREDKLGFSSIYIQAKRWDNRTSIGRPEIQKFVGALVGQGAQKGLFISTAQFTREAQNYAKNQSAAKVVLVNGDKLELAKLMIEYDLGVSTQNTYAIKKMRMTKNKWVI